LVAAGDRPSPELIDGLAAATPELDPAERARVITLVLDRLRAAGGEVPPGLAALLATLDPPWPHGTAVALLRLLFVARRGHAWQWLPVLNQAALRMPVTARGEVGSLAEAARDADPTWQHQLAMLARTLQTRAELAAELPDPQQLAEPEEIA
jgi:hypothetical protein